MLNPYPTVGIKLNKQTEIATVESDIRITIYRRGLAMLNPYPTVAIKLNKQTEIATVESDIRIT